MVAFNAALLLPLLPLLGAVLAHSNTPAHMRHRKHNVPVAAVHHGARAAPGANTAHAEAFKMVKKNVKKRQLKTCRKKDETPFSAPATSSSTSALAPTSTQSSPEGVAAVAVGGGSTGTATTTTSSSASSAFSSDEWGTTTSSSDWSQPTSSQSAQPSSGGGGGGIVGTIGGLLNVNDPVCGWCGSDAANPNGLESWINCGVDGAGWTPPKVTLDQLIVVELDGNSAFSACSQYIDTFNQVGQSWGIPPVLLAAIAMQESGCNAGATGGNGEAGLMQLASMWCGDAPGGNCYDVNYNINGGAKVFKTYYDGAGQSFFLAMGQYNGWQQGMTVADATRAASQGQCFAQNNLDYLTQIANGWLQGKDGHALGTYFNLNSC